MLGAGVLILSVRLGIGSLNNPQAGFMPFWAALLLMVFSLVLFGLTLRDKTGAVHWTDLWHNLDWPKSVSVAAFLIAYIVLLIWAGYLIATGLLMLVLFRQGSMKIRNAAWSAALSVAFTYGLFHFVLKIPLPRGVLGF